MFFFSFVRRWMEGKFFRLFCGIGLGLIGWATNRALASLDISGHIMLGGAFALLSLRLFGGAAGIIAVSIAAVATIDVWNHPWSWVVWTMEGIFLAAFLKRNSLLISDCIFWIFLGAPLLIVFYGVWMKVDPISLKAVIAKQIANGLLNVVLAEGLYVCFLRNQAIKRYLRLPPMSTSSFVTALLVAFSIIPALLIYVIQMQIKEAPLFGSIEKTISDTTVQVKSKLTDLIRIQISASLARLVSNIQTRATESITRDAGSSVNDLDMLASDKYRKSDARIECSGRVDWTPLATQFLNRSDHKDFEFSVSHTNKRFNISSSLENAEGSICRIVDKISVETFQNIFHHLSSSPYLNVILLDGNENLVLSSAGRPDGAVMQLIRKKIRSGEGRKPEALLDHGFGVPKMLEMKRAMWAQTFNVGSNSNWTGLVLYSPRKKVGNLRALQLTTLTVALTATAISIALAYLISQALSKSFERATRRIENGEFVTGWSFLPHIVQEVRDFDTGLEEVGSSLRHALKEFRVGHEHLAAFLSHAPIVGYRTTIQNGARGTVISISDSVTRVLGYSLEEVMEGDWWKRNVHSNDLRELETKFSSLSLGIPVKHEYRFSSKSGKCIWLEDTFVPVLDGDGNWSGTGMLLDVTDRKDTYLQHLRAARMANLGEMATSMAHELNQPLNTIKIAAFNIKTRLEKDLLDRESCENGVNRIIRQTDRAASLISHMRIFGRGPSAPAQPFQIEDAVSGALVLVEHQFDVLGIQIGVDIEADLPPILGHLTLMEQVFVNLFLNVRDALKFKYGRERAEIADLNVTARLDEGLIEVQVIDNAGGIKDEILDRVFEPFLTTKEVGEGVGLGLSISYGIIGDMGGTVTAANVGGGACFTIKLPAFSED